VRLQVPNATVRQRQVLQLIAEGRSYDQIGTRLYITSETVKTHVQRLYKLLGARGTSANLVHKAYQRGLLPPPHLSVPSGKDSR
jgi:DNA-binding NarL/FixJ family response regulator